MSEEAIMEPKNLGIQERGGGGPEPVRPPVEKDSLPQEPAIIRACGR